MSKKLERASLPGWPKLMSKDLAAAYLDISAPKLAKLKDLQPKHHLGKALYLRDDLDKFSEGLSLKSDWLEMFDDDCAA